jgi:hypothetical protein
MEKQENERKYILDCEYSEPMRPFSQKELEEMIANLKETLKLSEHKLRYKQNNYVYYAKKYGKKEKKIIENKENGILDYNLDIFGCSIEWQLKKTPNKYKDIANDIIEAYMDFEHNPPKKLSYFNIEIFRMFYSWVYLKT